MPYYYEPKRPSYWWAWALVCLLIVVGIVVLGYFTSDMQRGGSEPQSEHYLATLYVEGTMDTALSFNNPYDHQYLLDTLAELAADEDNAALLLYIDSPGGLVLAADELSRAVQRYKDETGRPVYAYGYEYAASGGYWLASTADRIMLNPYCISGSIGVSMGYLTDASELLEEHGIHLQKLASGELKQADDGFTPITEEVESAFRSIVDEEFMCFVNWVAEHRGISAEQVVELADGRIYSGMQAVSRGLADETGDYEELVAEICADLDEDLVNYHFFPDDEYTYLDLIARLYNGGIFGRAAVDQLSSELHLNAPVALYAPGL